MKHISLTCEQADIPALKATDETAVHLIRGKQLARICIKNPQCVAREMINFLNEWSKQVVNTIIFYAVGLRNTN